MRPCRTPSTKSHKCQTDNPDTQKFCGECATPLQPSKDIGVTKTIELPIKGLAIGSTLAGRYEILEPLGRGGMGEVYKVRDTKLDEEMALKLLKPDIASDEIMIERFRNELKNGVYYFPLTLSELKSCRSDVIQHNQFSIFLQGARYFFINVF